MVVDARTMRIVLSFTGYNKQVYDLIDQELQARGRWVPITLTMQRPRRGASGLALTPRREPIASFFIPLLALLLGACGGSNPSPAPPGTGAETGNADSQARVDSAGSGVALSASRPPDFELETIDGDTVRLSDHLGKRVVLIDFWATFCDPCLAAMPHLDRLYQRYKEQGFVVLGVSIDGPDSVAQVRTEVSKLGVSFPILLDSESSVVALYNPKTSAPYSVLIGRDGAVLTKREGYTSAGGDQLEADIQRAISAPEH
jgi:peroxiredoxin